MNPNDVHALCYCTYNCVIVMERNDVQAYPLCWYNYNCLLSVGMA